MDNIYSSIGTDHDQLDRARLFKQYKLLTIPQIHQSFQKLSHMPCQWWQDMVYAIDLGPAYQEYLFRQRIKDRDQIPHLLELPAFLAKCMIIASNTDCSR